MMNLLVKFIRFYGFMLRIWLEELIKENLLIRLIFKFKKGLIYCGKLVIIIDLI